MHARDAARRRRVAGRLVGCRRWLRRRCVTLPLFTLGLPCVILRRPTLATRVASSLHGFPVARSRARARARRAAPSPTSRDRRRRAASPRARARAAGPTVFAIRSRAQRLGLVVADRLLDRDALEQVAHRSVARRRARRGSRRVDASASNARARDRIGEQRARRASRRRARARGSRSSSTSSSRRSTRTAARAARGASARRRGRAPAASARAPLAARRAPPSRGAGRRRCRARRRASSRTGRARGRSGARATIAAAASAARARPSSVARSAAASTRSRRNCRNGVAALDRLQRALAGRRATRRPGSRPAGRSATCDLDLVALLPPVPLLGRALAGGVGVVGEHHLAGEVLEDLEVVVGERGAARGDRVRRAGERERHDVGVALADDDLARARRSRAFAQLSP